MKKLEIGLFTLFSSFLVKCQDVLAASDYKPEDIKSGKGDMFNPVVDTVDELGASGYKVSYRIAIMSAVICIIMVCIAIMWKRSPMAKEENKSNFGYVLLGLAGAAGAVSIVSTVVGIVEGIG